MIQSLVPGAGSEMLRLVELPAGLGKSKCEESLPVNNASLFMRLEKKSKPVIRQSNTDMSRIYGQAEIVYAAKGVDECD